MTQTVSKKQQITPQAIALINSLGGPALTSYQSVGTLATTLENQACADIPVWVVNVAQQALRQQVSTKNTMPMFALRKDKTNPYMTF